MTTKNGAKAKAFRKLFTEQIVGIVFDLQEMMDDADEAKSYAARLNLRFDTKDDLDDEIVERIASVENSARNLVRQCKRARTLAREIRPSLKAERDMLRASERRSTMPFAR